MLSVKLTLTAKSVNSERAVKVSLNPNTYQRSTSPLIRTTRRRRCPECGKYGWCEMRADGSAVHCMHRASAYPARSRLGGWWHYYDQPSVQLTRPAPRAAPPPEQRASIEQRHAAYTALLDALTLSDLHRADLTRRGLPPEKAAQYRSTPTEPVAADVTRELSRLCELRGVPGFYECEGVRRMVWMPQGYFVPYRDEQGRIQALQIRRWPHAGSDKYIWLSSNGKPRGASSGSPVHFAQPDRLNGADEVWLTEGALKADVASDLLKVPFIAAAGVGNFGQEFASALRKKFPHITEAVVAFDADFKLKADVLHAIKRLAHDLSRAGFKVVTRSWPLSEGKGIDDYALALSRWERRMA